MKVLFKSEESRTFIVGLGCLKYKALLMVAAIHFWQHTRLCQNCVLLLGIRREFLVCSRVEVIVGLSSLVHLDLLVET